MRNIEIKARLRDVERAAAVAVELAGPPAAELRQVDTYFHVADGRLKLREITGDETSAELIFYRRPDIPGPKPCDYLRAPVDSPDEIKATLAAALGVWVVVDKFRTVHLWRNVRIHLDRVEGLGAFLEFEAVLDENQTDDDGAALLDTLSAHFQLNPPDRVEGSYSDLMAKA